MICESYVNLFYVVLVVMCVKHLVVSFNIADSLLIWSIKEPFLMFPNNSVFNSATSTLFKWLLYSRCTLVADLTFIATVLC